MIYLEKYLKRNLLSSAAYKYISKIELLNLIQIF